MRFVLLAAACLAAGLAFARAAQVGGHTSPFYFAEEGAEERAQAETRRAAEEAGRQAARPIANPYADLGAVRHLEAGKYEAKVSGLLCNACTKAVVEELQKLKGVQAAEFDFEEGILRLTIKKDARVRFSQILRAVRHAGRRVKLGNQLALVEIGKGN